MQRPITKSEDNHNKLQNRLSSFHSPLKQTSFGVQTMSEKRQPENWNTIIIVGGYLEYFVLTLLTSQDEQAERGQGGFLCFCEVPLNTLLL